MNRAYDRTYVKFIDWLITATTIDEFDYADWLRANCATVAVEMEDGWTQEDVGVFLRELFVSEKRMNLYPRERMRP